MESLLPDTIVTQGHLVMGPLGSTSEGEKSTISSPTNNSIDQAYLEGLLRERESLVIGSGMELTRRLVNQEIERIQNGGKVKAEEKRMSDVTKDKSIKLTVKVLVPVKDHPKFNFVGKLLGPKGNSLKRLQEETMTKMAILGRGSMRDKHKEEELRLSGDQKFNHLSDDLHVEVAALAPPAEAHARIAYALTEIRRYLVPDYNDDIRQEQMREMQIINSSTTGNILNGHLNILNGAINGSEEGSCSPHSTAGAGDIQAPLLHSEARRSTTNKINLGALGSAHPALRGLNRTQTVGGTATTGKDSSSLKTRSSSHSRRSVLSLLTKARAIQQKEHEILSVFNDIPSYFVNEPSKDLVLKEFQNDESNGRNSGSFKLITSPTERARFRHDPYTRVASLT